MPDKQVEVYRHSKATSGDPKGLLRTLLLMVKYIFTKYIEIWSTNKLLAHSEIHHDANLTSEVGSQLK